YAATRAATHAATDAATRAATQWYRLDIGAMTRIADELGVGTLGLGCAQNAWNMWQGGNQWSAWESYLSFFRHDAKLPIDYSNYDHWEKAAIHSGPRFMHREFCIVSDRPVKLTVNDRNQPHSYDAPFTEWSDGSAIYSINGIRVPAWIAETKREALTKQMILSETNVDNRRCIISKI